MIVLKMLLAAIAFVLLIGPLNAHANIIYNWTGDCQGIAPGSIPDVLGRLLFT